MNFIKYLSIAAMCISALSAGTVHAAQPVKAALYVKYNGEIVRTGMKEVRMAFGQTKTMSTGRFTVAVVRGNWIHVDVTANRNGTCKYGTPKTHLDKRFLRTAAFKPYSRMSGNKCTFVWEIEDKPEWK